MRTKKLLQLFLIVWLTVQQHTGFEKGLAFGVLLASFSDGVKEVSLPKEGVGLMCGKGDWVVLITVFGVVVAESSSGLASSSVFFYKGNANIYQDRILCIKINQVVCELYVGTVKGILKLNETNQ